MNKTNWKLQIQHRYKKHLTIQCCPVHTISHCLVCHLYLYLAYLKIIIMPLASVLSEIYIYDLKALSPLLNGYLQCVYITRGSRPFEERSSFPMSEHQRTCFRSIQHLNIVVYYGGKKTEKGKRGSG